MYFSKELLHIWKLSFHKSPCSFRVMRCILLFEFRAFFSVWLCRKNQNKVWRRNKVVEFFREPKFDLIAQRFVNLQFETRFWSANAIKNQYWSVNQLLVKEVCPWRMSKVRNWGRLHQLSKYQISTQNFSRFRSS